MELQAEEGVWKQLTSPDYPNNYCNSMQCQYLITAPPGYHVAVNITELFLEPNEDVLAIFDGSNITDQRIRLFVFVFFFLGIISRRVQKKEMLPIAVNYGIQSIWVLSCFCCYCWLQEPVLDLLTTGSCCALQIVLLAGIAHPLLDSPI
ncbi:unnamed protein product [Gongylonema pulchrum]|uniref:CUB domain-containing protein n=1 Tax=Gongylonema pulchrum TaxID=637853 RepID=A0A3P7PLQ4_9BILA|nr:unnamed protein product [Gongylonema pulchrum]